MGRRPCSSSILPVSGFTKTAQDAPVIHAGEEWAFLVWGRGTGVPKPLGNFISLCNNAHVMKTTITAKLKLHTDTAQFQALRQTQLAYRDALNYVSRYAFEHGKLSNKVGL